MAAIFDVEEFEPVALSRTSKKPKAPAKGKAASALKTYKKKVGAFYAKRRAWTASAKRTELERIAAFCLQERINLDEQRDGIAILLKLYRTKAARPA